MASAMVPGPRFGFLKLNTNPRWKQLKPGVWTRLPDVNSSASSEPVRKPAALRAKRLPPGTNPATEQKQYSPKAAPSRS
jgi:hypothetical protein